MKEAGKLQKTFFLISLFYLLFAICACENPYMFRDLQPIIDARDNDEPIPLDVFFTVIFDSMGGSEVAPLVDLAYGSTITKPEDPVYEGHGFYGWYKEAEHINLWNFDSDVVTKDITLYARWIENSLVVTVDFEQIINEAPVFGSFIISRSGSGYLQKAVVTFNAADFDSGSIKWQIAGVGAFTGTVITGIDAEFEFDAQDIRYNSLGNHILLLEVQKDGRTYKVNIYFTIVE